MPKPPRDAAAEDAPRSPAGGPDTIAAALTATAVLASWVAVDPKSIDAFDAPKIALTATALAAAAVAAIFARIRRDGFRLPRPALPALLFAAGLAGAVVAAAASARRGQSFDALRSAALVLLALPVGSSAAYGLHRRKIVAVLGAAAAANGVLVLLSAARLWAPFAVNVRSDRSGLGGLVGNAGFAGVSLAIAAVAILPFAVARGRARPFAIAASGIAAAGVVATRSLSGIAVVAAGAAVYAALTAGRRARKALGIGAAAAVLVVAAYSPLRNRGIQLLSAARRGEWNAAVTARLAPWLAAREMIRAHPWVGIGPGVFRSEYIPARIAAENRTRRRLVLWGMPTNSFAQAHNDYLDLLAAIGIPAGACVLAAAAMLGLRLSKRARADEAAASAVSLLAAGAVAAFAWFPFQILPAAVWLLFEAGRGYRIAGRAR